MKLRTLALASCLVFVLAVSSCSTMLDYKNAPISNISSMQMSLIPPEEEENNDSALGMVLQVAKAVATVATGTPTDPAVIDDLSIWMETMFRQRLVQELSVPLLPETTSTYDFSEAPWEPSWSFVKIYDRDSESRANIELDVQMSWNKESILGIGIGAADIGISSVRPKLRVSVRMVDLAGDKTLWSDSVEVQSRTTSTASGLNIFGVSMADTEDQNPDGSARKQQVYRDLYLQAIDILIQRVLAN